MAIEKKILINKPFRKARGQYTHEDGDNLGITLQGEISTENELYTISEKSPGNEESLVFPGGAVAGTGGLRITQLNYKLRPDIDSITGEDYTTNNIDMRFHLWDGASFTGLNDNIIVDSNGFTTFRNGDNQTHWRDMDEYLCSKANCTDFSYFYFTAYNLLKGEEGCPGLIGRFISHPDEWMTSQTNTSTHGIADNSISNTAVPNLGGAAAGAFTFVPRIDDSDGSHQEKPMDTFFNFPGFPYVNSDNYYTNHNVTNNQVLYDANPSDWPNGWGDDYNLECDYKPWFDESNLSSTDTMINIEDWYNAKLNYHNPSSAFYFAVLVNSTSEGDWGRDEAVQIYRLPKYVFYDAWISGKTKTIKFVGSDPAVGDASHWSGATQWHNNLPIEIYDPFDSDSDDQYIFPWPTSFSEGAHPDDLSGTVSEAWYGDPPHDPTNEQESTNTIFMLDATFEITPPTAQSILNDNLYNSSIKGGKIINKNFPIDINPSSPVNYQLTGITGSAQTGDFHPISFISSSYNDIDLQIYHDDVEDKIQTSAPLNVSLSFKIAESSPTFDISYIEKNQSDWDSSPVNFIATVINWDWRDGDPDTWASVINDYPKSEVELSNRQRNYNTYNFERVHGGEQLTHSYDKAGIKIIKAIVFSHGKFDFDPSTKPLPDYIQPIRWKLLTIKINIGVDAVYIQDFGDIGGSDYTFIPWPQTAPIISGISNESKYINTLNGVVKQNKFREDEVLDKTLAFNAIENDELGNYLGKSDIAQVRYFTDASYDMNKLLMIDNRIIRSYCLIDTNGDGVMDICDELTLLCEDNATPCVQDWRSYENIYWTGESLSTSYPDESCVGTIFIDDNMNDDLKSETLIELNMDEIDERTIRDSSGNGFKGILLGDYSIRKDSKEIGIRRETNIQLPETDDEKRAF